MIIVLYLNPLVLASEEIQFHEEDVEVLSHLVLLYFKELPDKLVDETLVSLLNPLVSGITLTFPYFTRNWF